MANSTKIFNEIRDIEDEMSQLETTRKFHLSLYSQVIPFSLSLKNTHFFDACKLYMYFSNKCILGYMAG